MQDRARTPARSRAALDPDRGHLGVVAFGLALAMFAAFQQFKLPVVLPVLLERYGYDRVLAATFMSVYALAGLFLSLPLGRLVAARGAYRPILVALALLAAGSAVTLARPESGSLMLAARALEGIAFAVLAITGPVLAQAHAPSRHLGLVIGLTAAWIPIGQLGAVLLAPLALATVGWTLLWQVGLALAAGLALWAHRLQGTTGTLGAPGRAGGSATGTPPPALNAVQRLDLALVACVFMLWSGQYFAYMTWLPQYLVDVHGSDVNTALLGYVVPVVLVACFNVVAGTLLRAGWCPGSLMAAAMATQAAVWWLLPWADGSATGLASLVAYGIGAGVVPTCLFAMPSAVLGQAQGTARAFGVVMTGRNLGVLIGPVLLAQVFKAAGDWHLASPVFGALTTACLLISGVLAVRLAGARR